MNFIEAVKIAKEKKIYLRRPGWNDGIAIFYAAPKSADDKKLKYSRESRGNPYLATCHIAACELGGIRLIDDILAEDWELYYKD